MKKSMRQCLVWLLAAAMAGQNIMPVMADIDRENNVGKSFLQISTPANAAENIATPSSADMILKNSTTGDLWNGWDGDMEFPGFGTKQEPYQISTLFQLMGLSEIVASGTSFEGKYFELINDIDLGGLERNWNPIGWYQNEADLFGEVDHPFKGHFDGLDNTISGLHIIDNKRNLPNVGLFGVIEGGSVKNLKVQADDVLGTDNVGILAGRIKGDTVIYNVAVSGYIQAKQDAGGIAGEIIGGSQRVTIENCVAENIVINSELSAGYVGGIAGNVQKADLVDCMVMTQDGNADRIQGKGYVGGISGRMNQTNIYNSYVSGTIGGNGTKAAGGVVGKYESGNLILARFAGDISKTNQGTASREGTFVGTRESKDKFTYGIEKNNNISYLFTTSANKAKTVFGSNIDGDNKFTKSAHIGYWTDYEKKYITVAGTTETGCGDRYFYEELEDGIRYIVIQKLGKEFTADGYAKGLAFSLDHFAPGYQGEPIRGYLLSVPRIDAKNANGTFDTDVAVLTAMPAGNNSYYRVMDKDYAAAVAPGISVSVSTSAKNSDGKRYQMVMDKTEPGGVKAPTYVDDFGSKAAMTYMSSGSYTFTMPERDTEINAEYEKVSTQLTMTPEETTVTITHTRNGDRKNPETLTEVKNQEGVLIARYINDALDTSIQVQPISIHAEHNDTGAVVDRAVKWSVDDIDLLLHTSETGYTTKDAVVMPNMNSAFLTGTLNREVKAQAANGYNEVIKPTMYKKSAVVTATTNPATSANHQSVYGNTKVNVAFQIIDNTTVRVEEISLNEQEIYLTITRTLTGKRSNPTSDVLTVSGDLILTASLFPTNPLNKNVSWSNLEGQNIIQITPNKIECGVSANYDSAGKQNPAWIQNLINQDNKKKALDTRYQMAASGTYEVLVTVTAEDQTHGHLTDTCKVILHFETKDNTYINSGGSGGSGGSSGGGGGGSTGVTPGGSKTSSSAPIGSVTGTWVQTAEGTWIFTSGGRTYTNEWAYIHNPYAEDGQPKTSWFRFNEAGYMVNGWYQDMDGSRYYLNPATDNTQGRMVTGWQWIEGNCYYFSEIITEGNPIGALLRDRITPDGYTVNTSGAWVSDGVIQTK